MPVEGSNRAFLIQSQVSCQIDERAKSIWMWCLRSGSRTQ